MSRADQRRHDAEKRYREQMGEEATNRQKQLAEKERERDQIPVVGPPRTGRRKH